MPRLGPTNDFLSLMFSQVDILTSDEARMTKAEELAPPQFLDYQLRVVLWATAGVKFPQLENRGLDVDQKLIVTANFGGESGKVLYHFIRTIEFMLIPSFFLLLQFYFIFYRFVVSGCYQAYRCSMVCCRRKCRLEL